MGITTSISVYRGKSSFIEYVTAGALTGMGYKFNMGPRGMAVGGLLGGALGGIAGGLSLLILNASGMSMEEVRYWQYKWRAQRDAHIHGAIKVFFFFCWTLSELFKFEFSFTQKSSNITKDDLLDEHDKTVGTDKISLDNLDTEKIKNE